MSPKLPPHAVDILRAVYGSLLAGPELAPPHKGTPEEFESWWRTWAFDHLLKGDRDPKERGLLAVAQLPFPQHAFQAPRQNMEALVGLLESGPLQMELGGRRDAVILWLRTWCTPKLESILEWAEDLEWLAQRNCQALTAIIHRDILSNKNFFTTIHVLRKYDILTRNTFFEEATEHLMESKVSQLRRIAWPLIRDAIESFFGPTNTIELKKEP